jgi:NADH-quinone oxidoreductase subunit N
MLGYSGVAQAGYMLGGVVVGNKLGIDATVLYIAIYLGMNLAAFAVIAAVEREDPRRDDISTLSGLGTRRPWLAWPMTIAMLSLAGIPGTAGFIGKFQLIHALVHGDYLWLAIVLVVGSMISLGYYLRVVATMWMGSYGAAPAPVAATAAEGSLPPIAGGSQESATPPQEPTQSDVPGPAAWVPIAAVAVLFAAATIFFGIVPQPLFHLANHAGQAISGLFY